MKKSVLKPILLFSLILCAAVFFVSCGGDGQEVKVTYVLGGGSLPASAPESYEKGNAPNFSKIIPEREHHDFEGWYTNAVFTERFRASSVSGDHVTLYAKWNAHKYNITYELFGGDGSNLPEMYTYGTTLRVSVLQPKRGNYIFDGWYTDSGFENSITKISPTDYGDITLYAKWIPDRFGISYELFGGEGNNFPSEYIYGSSVDLTKLQPTRENYTFEGWFYDTDYKNEALEISRDSIGEITLYAKWRVDKYTIEYELSGGECENLPTEYEYGSEIDLLQYRPTKENWLFAGWFGDAEMRKPIYSITADTSGNLTLYAKWMPKA